MIGLSFAADVFIIWSVSVRVVSSCSSYYRGCINCIRLDLELIMIAVFVMEDDDQPQH